MPKTLGNNKRGVLLTVISEIRVGFVISHPFHYHIYKNVIKKLPNALIAIETRKDTPFQFSPDFLNSLACDHMFVSENDLIKLDNAVDVIFLMTPKHLGAGFKIARTIALQYGLAKEYYNYGLWRSRADLNLMYGNYSANVISGHALAKAVGNPRFDGYKPRQIGGNGALYIPTYGDLSTLGKFSDLIKKTKENFNIKVKLHHASEFADKEIIDNLKLDPRVEILDGYRDALDDISAADMVISDYSGSIFDAVALRRPVTLFQPGYAQKIKRTDDRSLEISRAQDLGTVVKTDEEFLKVITGQNPATPKLPSEDLYEALFSNFGSASDAIIAEIENLVNGKFERTVVQQSLADTYIKLVSKKSPPKRKKVSKLKKIMSSALTVLRGNVR